jgi:hypothetical protein
MPPSGIRTHDPSNKAAADLRLTPRSHWDRLYIYILEIKIRYFVKSQYEISSHDINSYNLFVK